MANYIHVPDEAPAVPKIDVTVDESDYRSGALKLIKELRPSWKPSEVKIKVLLLQSNSAVNPLHLQGALQEKLSSSKSQSHSALFLFVECDRR